VIVRVSRRNRIIKFVDVDMGVNREAACYTDHIGRYLRGERHVEHLIRRPSVCHPKRPNKARGMCVKCYSHWRHWLDGIKNSPPSRLTEYGIGRNGRNPDERLM
jgi:hypothetical protein